MQQALEWGPGKKSSFDRFAGGNEDCDAVRVALAARNIPVPLNQ